MPLPMVCRRRLLPETAGLGRNRLSSLKMPLTNSLLFTTPTELPLLCWSADLGLGASSWARQQLGLAGWLGMGLKLWPRPLLPSCCSGIEPTSVCSLKDSALGAKLTLSGADARERAASRNWAISAASAGCRPQEAHLPASRIPAALLARWRESRGRASNGTSVRPLYVMALSEHGCGLAMATADIWTPPAATGLLPSATGDAAAAASPNAAGGGVAGAADGSGAAVTAGAVVGEAGLPGCSGLLPQRDRVV